MTNATSSLQASSMDLPFQIPWSIFASGVACPFGVHRSKYLIGHLASRRVYGCVCQAVVWQSLDARPNKHRIYKVHWLFRLSLQDNIAGFTAAIVLHALRSTPWRVHPTWVYL